MNQPKKCSAINALRLLTLAALLFNGTLAYAATAGSITHLSGPLFAKKADGTVKVLSEKSTVEPGDILVTEKNTYARIKFIDSSEITLRPNSQFRIDSFAFDEDKKDKDSAVFNLIKGGLRAVTGLLGKRSKERFEMNTPTATIGIRGTTYIVEYVPEDAPSTESVAAYNQASMAALDAGAAFPAGMTDAIVSDAPHTAYAAGIVPLQLAQNLPTASKPGTLAPGLHVHVIDGIINLSNKGGSQNFSAGQFGYTANVTKPPVVVPSNPGLKFTPPPTFSSSTGTQGGSTSNKSNAVDCIVR